MVEVELREAYMNENQVFVIIKLITMPDAPVRKMGIINRAWSEFDKYDYVTDVFIPKRVVYDCDDNRYLACSKIEMNELSDDQLQRYVVRMLKEIRIGWTLYKVIKG